LRGLRFACFVRCAVTAMAAMTDDSGKKIANIVDCPFAASRTACATAGQAAKIEHPEKSISVDTGPVRIAPLK